MTGPDDWEVEFYADDAGREPCRAWMEKLPPAKRIALEVAMQLVLAWRGLRSAVIDRLLQERRLESGRGADASPWLERARQTLAAARAIEQPNPDSAFVLAYDAARQACEAASELIDAAAKILPNLGIF
jgi:hypothetical protein